LSLQDDPLYFVDCALRYCRAGPQVSEVWRTRRVIKFVIRQIVIRYAIPVVAAVSVIAFVGVPLIDQLLAGWFRSDIQTRAQLVMMSIEEPLDAILERGDHRRALAYLERVAGDE
jgi:hypothetical protein